MRSIPTHCQPYLAHHSRVFTSRKRSHVAGEALPLMLARVSSHEFPQGTATHLRHFEQQIPTPLPWAIGTAHRRASKATPQMLQRPWQKHWKLARAHDRLADLVPFHGIHQS